MKQYKWMRFVIVFGLIVLFTAGCSLANSGDDKQAIDPPPSTVPWDVDGSMPTIADIDTAAVMTERTMYFKDPNGYVAPLSLQVPQVEGVAKQALGYMISGGAAEGVLPDGFTALLPEGTEILGLDIRPDHLAIVDFNKAFTNYAEEDERKIMEAITWTLTDFPSVAQVELRVNGDRLLEMPVAGTPLDEPMSRTMGINVEQHRGVMLSQADPVTLYFQSKAGDYSYIVPVTRLIDRTEDPAQATMEQLISGPLSNHLVPVMLPDVQVIGVEKNDQIITVNLSDDIAGPEGKVAPETLKSVILSLMDSTGASKVQVLVEGSQQVISTEDENYSFPVNRPEHLNRYES